MYLNVKKLSETATIPTRGSEKSAGLIFMQQKTVLLMPERPELFVLE